MKKVTTMFLATCLILAIVATSFSLVAFAASTATATIQGATGAPGDTVTASLNLTASEGMDNGQFDLIYDSTKLQVISADPGPLITATMNSINEKYTANTIRGAYAAGKSISSNGCLMTVKFKILNNASDGTADLTLKNVEIGDDAGAHMAVTCNNGSIKIQSSPTSSASSSSPSSSSPSSGSSGGSNSNSHRSHSNSVAPITCSITYNGNGNTGGSVPTDGNVYLQGDTVTVLGNPGNLSKENYTFANWNTASDGSGTNYVSGDKITAGTSNILLYALWSPKQCTIKFEANGAAKVDDKLMNYGAYIYNAPQTSKAGCFFDGWYSDSSLKNKIDFPYQVSGDATLFAKLEANSKTSNALGTSGTSGNHSEGFRSPKTGVGNTRVLLCEILCMVSSGTLLLLRKKPKHIAQHAVKKHAVSQ